LSQQFLKLIQRGQTAEVADAVADDPSLLLWRDPQGVSPLLWAVYSSQSLIVDFLKAERERASEPLDLFEAAATGDITALRQALGAAPELVNAHAGDGWTALHLAAAFATPEAVKFLIEHGASVSAVSTNPQANQPLHAALALSRNPEVIACLLAAGADPNGRQAGGFTALFSAAAANRRDLAQILIDNGADPSLSSDFGQTASSYARQRGNEDMAVWLDSFSRS
jgi:ankyrin repeat protein